MRFNIYLLALFPVLVFCQLQIPLNLDHELSPAALADLALTRLSEHERESLLVHLFEGHDVVSLMKLLGHGDGLDEERVVQVFGDEEPTKITEGEKYRLKQQGKYFMDITKHPTLGEQNAQRLRTTEAPSRKFKASGSTRIREMLDSLDLDDKHLRDDIKKLTSFWNRAYKSPWGLLSSNWIYEKVSHILKHSPNNETSLSVRKVSHEFIQNSVVARIERADDEAAAEDVELIIIGAHQDSLNYKLPFYRAPGADDDGSGTIATLQMLRSLVEVQFVPPPGVAVEFHWYAAEEAGLLGSQDIAADYEERGAKVRGMFQFDCVAFVKKGSVPTVGFFDQVVDMNLTDFATALVDTYLPIGWNYTNCGNHCGSDHMSWTKAGYPAIFAFESIFENGGDKFHTIYDDADRDGQYSFEHILNFVKLGIAFVVELAAQ